MITLTKDQTLLLHYHSNRDKIKRFKFSSKIESKCLKCFNTIYISYFENSTKSIFCNQHKNLSNNNNIAQLHYLRLIKEKQMNQF